MTCITQDFLRGYAHSAQNIINTQMELYFSVSPQEWELLKPSEFQRAVDIMDQLKASLRNEGHCGNCTSWMIKSRGKDHA